MIFRRLSIGLLGLAAMGPFSAVGAEYALDRHRIEWSGSMPASTHTGLLTPSAFHLSMSDAGEIEALKVTLDMDSIDVTDLTGRSRNRLMKHLRSEDFFFVSEHPTAGFELRAYRDGALHGTLTIRGVSKPFSIPVRVTPDGDGFSLNGAFSFDRQDFNVNYQNAGIFGTAKDKIIRDLIDLTIELRAVRLD